MLDSPVLTLAAQWLIRLAKRSGFIDRITPAGRTEGRREAFDDLDQARAYFSAKSLFRAFDPDCLEAYLQHGLKSEGEGLRLAFDPAIEMRIYRSIPHTRPASPGKLKVPLAMVRGSDSRIVRAHHAQAVRRMPLGENHSVAGGHMFPLERPADTASLIKGLFDRWSQA